MDTWLCPWLLQDIADFWQHTLDAANSILKYGTKSPTEYNEAWFHKSVQESVGAESDNELIYFTLGTPMCEIVCKHLHHLSYLLVFYKQVADRLKKIMGRKILTQACEQKFNLRQSF